MMDVHVGVGRDAWGAGKRPRDRVNMAVYAEDLCTWTDA